MSQRHFKSDEVCTLSEALRMYGCGIDPGNLGERMVAKPNRPKLHVNGNGSLWHYCGMSPVLFSFGEVYRDEDSFYPYFATCFGFSVCIEKDKLVLRPVGGN